MSDRSAEDLRLEGNQAFAAKNWKEAVESYQGSIKIDGTSKDSAKVYSNLAAALCKLSKYDDAYEAAKKAPDVDPEWAKGYWRLGVVCELQRDFSSALSHYDKANKLAPNERAFKLALEKMKKRMKVEKVEDGTYISNEFPPSIATKRSSRDDLEDGTEKAPVCMVAWNRLRKRTNNLTKMNGAFPAVLMDGDDMKSEWWLQYGLQFWYSAMLRQLGELSGMPSTELSNMNQKTNKIKFLRQRGEITQQQYDERYTEITGCPPQNGQEITDFLHAVTGLGGDQIPIEMGGGDFVPSPKWLSWYKQQQFVAVYQSIFNKVAHMKVRVCGVNPSQPSFWNNGEECVFSSAVCTAAKLYLGNTGQSTDIAIKEGTPEEVIDYCKKKLRKGTTWEGDDGKGGGIREYVSFVYRGTVLYGFISRMLSGLGPALKQFKWANRFITLADKEWKVTQSGDYEKHGATFRKSFQVGALQLELGTAFFLTNNGTPRKEEALHMFNLCQTMINFAKEYTVAAKPTFDSWWFATSFGRKPLAYALSLLAQLTIILKSDADLLYEVIDETGLFDPNRDDNLFSYLSGTSGRNEFSVNLMLAEVYKAAAIAQLPDDNEQHILWWGYAAHLAESGGYELGELRSAIENATLASTRVDEDLFGPSIYKGSVYPKMAIALARHFEAKPDSFILPMLEKESRPDGSVALFCDGHLLRSNFDRDLRIDHKRVERTVDAASNDYFDNAEVEKEHGAES